MKNIVLTGMMGCGKSTVGRLLAKRLNRELADTDQLIVEREGRPIPEIFAADGEARFRELERQAAEELSRRQDLIIACGGGLPMRDDCIAPLRETGVVVFLNRDPGLIYDTVSMSGRPLGQGGREAFLARFESRKAQYFKTADLVIQSLATPSETAEALLRKLREMGEFI